MADGDAAMGGDVLTGQPMTTGAVIKTYYTPGYGVVDTLIVNGMVYVMNLCNIIGEVEGVDSRFAVYSPANVDVNSVPKAVIDTIDEIPDRDVRDRLLKGVDQEHGLLAKLGYRYGSLRYRIAYRSRQYVLTFAPKPNKRVDTRQIVRLMNSIYTYIETWEPLYGTVEYVISYMLREVHFPLEYNYYTLDDVCAVLWTIDGDSVYVRRLCDLEFVRHIYDPRRI